MLLYLTIFIIFGILFACKKKQASNNARITENYKVLNEIDIDELTPLLSTNNIVNNDVLEEYF